MTAKLACLFWEGVHGGSVSVLNLLFHMCVSQLRHDPVEALQSVFRPSSLIKLRSDAGIYITANSRRLPQRASSGASERCCVMLHVVRLITSVHQINIKQSLTTLLEGVLRVA